MESNYYEGVLDGIKDFLVGMGKMAEGTVKYGASASVCAYGKVSGEDVPDWAKKCYNTTNNKILGVIQEPVIIVESLAQGVSDSFETKSSAYCGGYAAGTVASNKACTV